MRAGYSAVLLLAVALPALAEPKLETVKAFERYVATAEARIRAEELAHPSNNSQGGAPDTHPSKTGLGGPPPQGGAPAFLRIESLGGAERQEAEARLKRGEVLVEKVGQTPQDVPGGMIHDWVGTAFVPGATVAQVLSLVQDYNDLARYYQPDVQSSRLISRTGDNFHIYMRLRKHKVVTVLLDTEYDVHYGLLDPQHWFSESRSTRISEAGGGNHGFLWRLNSYWRFVQVNDGVIVQCEAISLTRDIPTGLGWMIAPFVTKIPRESLEFTMTQTRKAVEKCEVQSAKCEGENKRSFDSDAPRSAQPVLAQDDNMVGAGRKP